MAAFTPGTRKASAEIVNLIARGLLPRNQRVREVQLSEQLGMSRVPLREAMNRLASHGVLEPRPRGGMNVKAFSAVEIEEIAQVRVALEPIALRAATPALEVAANRIQLNAIIEELSWAAGKADREAIANADMAFHRYLIELSGNRLIQQIWEGLELQLLIVFRLELTQPAALNEVVAKHKALRDTLLEGNFTSLNAMLSEHVRPVIIEQPQRNTTER